MSANDHIRVRRYREADHDRVWELHNTALHQVDAHGGNGPWDDDLHDIPSVYLDAGGEFLVGEVDGEIVAMGALRPTGARRAEIKRMRVDPAYQRRGYGRLLLERLEDAARTLGLTTLHLDTTAGQRAAQQLYRGAGYRETGRGRLGRFELIRFEKQLGA